MVGHIPPTSRKDLPTEGLSRPLLPVKGSYNSSFEECWVGEVFRGKEK